MGSASPVRVVQVALDPGDVDRRDEFAGRGFATCADALGWCRAAGLRVINETEVACVIEQERQRCAQLNLLSRKTA